MARANIGVVYALTLAITQAASTTAAGPSTKPTISSETDIPDTRFTVTGSPSSMFDTPMLPAMFPALRKEAERLLQDYDVRDPAIAGQLRLGLASIAINEGRRADAERLMTDYRAAQTKPQLRRLGGAFVDIAAAQVGANAGERCGLAAARLRTLLSQADPVVDRDQIVSYAGRFQVVSVPYFAGTAVGQIDPVAKTRGSIGVLDGMTLATWRIGASYLPACRFELGAVARAWLDEPAHAPHDFWAARQPGRSLLSAAKPVVVAVWDGGFDTSLFTGQLAHDPAEPIDGRDNDGDGVVDDANGPTWDVKLRPRNGPMMPPSPFLRPRLAAQMMLDKGQLDLRFGFDTVEARMFAERARTASTQEQGEDVLASAENGERSHGTACASEIADGQPFVRLYNVAALPWGVTEGPLEDAYDEATIARWAAAIETVGKRMRGAHVRVVNMSWNLTADEISMQLLEHGLETEATRAKLRGKAMQRTISNALRAMMTASPDILFVVAAGNSNQPDDILASTPADLTLPNLMFIGATGLNGKPTSFTTFGKKVDLYAQGEAVPLRWPGDISVHESGTSMATPLVVRAAVAMAAVKPKLSAEQLRIGLLQTSTLEAGGLKLLHPAAAVRWAKTH